MVKTSHHHVIVYQRTTDCVLKWMYTQGVSYSKTPQTVIRGNEGWRGFLCIRKQKLLQSENNKTHLLTELLDRASSLYEVLKEAVLSLQVAWGEQPQVHDHVVRHVLVVEGAQQLLQARLFLAQFDQVHELPKRKDVIWHLLDVRKCSFPADYSNCLLMQCNNVHYFSLCKKLTVLWKSSMVNSVKPSLTRSSLLLAATALNLKRQKK